MDEYFFIFPRGREWYDDDTHRNPIKIRKWNFRWGNMTVGWYCHNIFHHSRLTHQLLANIVKSWKMWSNRRVCSASSVIHYAHSVWETSSNSTRRSPKCLKFLSTLDSSINVSSPQSCLWLLQKRNGNFFTLFCCCRENKKL